MLENDHNKMLGENEVRLFNKKASLTELIGLTIRTDYITLDFMVDIFHMQSKLKSIDPRS